MATFNDFTLQQLFQLDTLRQLDQQFLQQLKQHDATLYEKLVTYRQDKNAFSTLEISQLLLDCAPILEAFLIAFFDIDQAVIQAQKIASQNNPIFHFKKWFVMRRARRRVKKANEITESFTALNQWLEQQLQPNITDKELAVAQLGQHFLMHKDQYQTEIEQLTRWCILALVDETGQETVKNWTSFRLPQQTDYAHLVPLETVPNDDVKRLQSPNLHQREGFKLTDKRMSLREVEGELRYCSYCHENQADSCSKGYKKSESELKKDPFDNVLTGCPLGEKISEMQVLKKDRLPIAALSMVMLDNPMCPVTGHRICNDCMKACIYQHQTPVNIPQIETRILTDVLDLPFGVEIYDLLTRWHPLRQQQYLPQPYNGLKVLVAGQGPAGFTLAHHLLMAGFAVVGIDGLKIEPLPAHLLQQPIKNYSELEEALDERIIMGFGGVAEYGITVRWDKNFLKLIYLSLARRPYFQVFGNVRFGGTITVEDAWQLGFDHVAIAVGAGLAQALPIPNSLASGMRQANDFLMALQLTSAAKMDGLTNLQVRLPAIVIGGGLTGIDTATEVQAYYLVQIERLLNRYEKLVATFGEDTVRTQFNERDQLILDELLHHAKLLRQEKANNPQFNPQKLLQQWGGVTVAYRRRLQDSPAYTHNHEEVTQALKEGLFYAENLTPKTVQLDQFSDVKALICEDNQGKSQTLSAKSIFVATGAKPNIAYEFENRGTFERVGFQYQMFNEIDGKLIQADPVAHCKTENFGAFTSYDKDDHRVTFIGDTHPVFHGSVVKAVASGMRTYPHIVKSFAEKALQQGSDQEYQTFRHTLNTLFESRLETITRHNDHVVELKIYAPMAVKKFHAGQFFRLQNYETDALNIENTRLHMSPLALLGTKADEKTGMINFFVFENSANAKLCATLKAGQKVALMGPTGVKTKIPDTNETVMIIGDKMSMATIQTVGTAMREAGNQVLYALHIETRDDIFCQSDLENAADTIIYATQQGQAVTTNRPQDSAAIGHLEDILFNYAQNPNATIPLQTVDRVLIVANNHLVKNIDKARKTVLKPYFEKSPSFTASVHTPMQCMLKGVCAQCLQWQVNPETGERTKAVFACSWHDQPMDLIDLDNVDERNQQDYFMEKFNQLWLTHVLNVEDLTVN